MLALAGGWCFLTHNHAAEQTARNTRNDVLRQRICVIPTCTPTSVRASLLLLAGHQQMTELLQIWEHLAVDQSCSHSHVYSLCSQGLCHVYPGQAGTQFFLQSQNQHSFSTTRLPPSPPGGTPFEFYAVTVPWALRGPDTSFYFQLQPPVPRTVTSPPDCCQSTDEPTPCWAWAGGRDTRWVRQTRFCCQSSHSVRGHRERTRASGSCRSQTGRKPRKGGQEQLSERGVWAANRANRKVDRRTSRGMNLAPPRTEMRPLC